MRIAVGGFQHETNTFAATRASLDDFIAADAWPGLTRGPALLEAVAGINLPTAGFIDAARSAGHGVVPLTWCSATPSGPVTRDAFERISAMLIEDLRQQASIDAVYLDLHGSMVAEHIDDADGELLRRVRQTVGADIPVVASLDFHANVSRQMLEQASVLLAYRTYPHVDMAATGERMLRCLSDLRTARPYRCLREIPFLIPLTSQCTLTPPMATLLAAVEASDAPPLHCLNFTPGFPAADVAKCGPVVFAGGSEPRAVEAAVAQIAALVTEHRSAFALDIHSIEAALREVQSVMPVRGRPVVLADTQDNPGGGGTASTTSLLKALIARQTPRVLAGVLYDPQAAARAHQAGIGATVDLAVGAQFGDSAGVPGETPIRGKFTVAALGDGRFIGTGPFYRGARMELGPMALVRIGDVDIVIASRKQQAADRAMFHHVGAHPEDFAVLVLKSSVHFRADFGAMASRVLVVAAPGPNVADPAALPFTKLQRALC